LGVIKEALYEPVGLWLPDNMRPADTGLYAQGVEVPADYAGEIPEGFDLMDLPACKMLVFQGEPFRDEDFEEAICALWVPARSSTPRPTATSTRPSSPRACSFRPRAGAGILRCGRHGKNNS